MYRQLLSHKRVIYTQADHNGPPADVRRTTSGYTRGCPADHQWTMTVRRRMSAGPPADIGQEELVSCSSDYSTRWLAIK
jgi:hypothetical protein